jgi:transposase
MDVAAEKINKSRLFRELGDIEDSKEDICRHLMKQYQQHFPDSLNEIYYDLSSTTFSGAKCLISKYGHCKEGYKTHVVLALLVSENGLPIYWEVLPGGTADAKTVQWLLNKCREKFTELNITAVFDRGFVSNENLGLFESDGIKYITAMDRNQIEGICGEHVEFTDFSEFPVDSILNEIRTCKDFTEVNESTFYREIKVDKERRFILCFNPQLFKDQRNAREKHLQDLRDDIIPALNQELREAKKSRQRDATKSKFKKIIVKMKLSTFVSVKLNDFTVIHKGAEIKSFQAEVIVHAEQKKEAIKLDGFWMLVSNLSEKNEQNEFVVTAENALRPYREKVIIEDAFRDIKSFLEVKPAYVWLEKHVKAHYTICVLAYLINRTISNKLKENPGDISADIKTHQSVYREFRNGSIDEIHIKNIKQSTYCLTQLSKKQKEILTRLKANALTRVDKLLGKFKGI